MGERAAKEGHDLGHPTISNDVPPLAMGWSEVVDGLARQLGGIGELAKQLQLCAPKEAKIPNDVTTIERGLRRLKRLEHAQGNKYGRWLLRCFGVPASLQRWAKEMGQYHSRWHDLPVEARWEQLQLWNRPPLSESREGIWIQLGLASLAYRMGDMQQLARYLTLAELLSPHAERAALIELLLFKARLAADQEHIQTSKDHLAAAMQLLKPPSIQPPPASPTSPISPTDTLCYLARLFDQLAYLASKPPHNTPSDLHNALHLYNQISYETFCPFAAFRRHWGRAWCLWRLGDLPSAEHEGFLALESAGDGGYLRLRVMALKLLAHIIGPSDPRQISLLTRALSIAKQLQDTQLIESLTKISNG
jgi:hypothetical protein